MAYSEDAQGADVANGALSGAGDGETRSAVSSLFITVAEVMASGVAGNAAYAFLASTVNRARERIRKSDRQPVANLLTKQEALALSRGLVANVLGCDPTALSRASQLFDPDDKSWIIVLQGEKMNYRVLIPFGDPQDIQYRIESYSGLEGKSTGT